MCLALELRAWPNAKRMRLRLRLGARLRGESKKAKCARPRKAAGSPLAFPGALPDNRLVKHTVTELTDQLIASYARVGGINHVDGKNLPSKTAIASITLDLLRLLFPGFFDEKSIHSSELKAQTATLMDSVSGTVGG